MTKKLTSWTNYDIEKIIKYRSQRMTYKQIASKIGRSSISIFRVCQSNNLTRKKTHWTRLEINRIGGYRSQGLTYQKISSITGRTRHSIQRICLLHNLTKRKAFISQAEALRLPHRLDELAKQFGITVKSMTVIKSTIKKRGVSVAEAIDPRIDLSLHQIQSRNSPNTTQSQPL